MEAEKYQWTDKGEEIVKLENIATIIAGYSAGKDELMDSGEVRYLSAKDITLTRELKAEESRYLKNSNASQQKAMVQPGDILLVCMGVNIGLVSQYTASQSAMAGSTLFIVRSEEPSLLDKLAAKIDEIKSLAKGTAIQRVFVKDLQELEL